MSEHCGHRFVTASSRFVAVAGIFAAAIVVVLSSSAWAGPSRPSFNVLRFEEDWSFLADYRGEPGRADGLKYIELGNGGDMWLSFGAQVRERVEAWSDIGFKANNSNDDVFLLSRIRAHADLHLSDTLRVFLEVKSSLASDRNLPGGRRTLDVDELAVQNGFAELSIPDVGDSGVTLRAGRQELLMGKQRLVSPLDWSNTRRTFDGFTASGAISGWQLEGFATRAVNIKKYDANDTNDGVSFYGLYVTNKQLAGIDGLDLYWLALERRAASFNGSSGAEDRHTLGGRVWGDLANTMLDYEFEGAYQTGEVGSADISAFMIASTVGTTLDEVAYKPRVEAGFDYASGDDKAGDGDVETFNQLFPLGHAYNGFIDAVSRQNIIDLRGSSSAKVPGGVKLKADLHYFWRADKSDGLYNAGGKLTRGSAAGASSFVGAELDLTAKKALSKHSLVIVGYSHFFAGEFLKDTGSSADIDFGYVTFQYTI